MKHIIQLGAGVLALSMGLATAWAQTQDEARVEIQKHADEKGLNAKDRTAAVETLNTLVQKGVPVERAYEVVEAAINKDIKGPELADIAKYIQDRRDEGVTADAAAAETVSHIERDTMQGAMHDTMQGTMRDTMQGTMRETGAGGGMGGSEAGAGAGAGGPDMGGGFGAGGR